MSALRRALAVVELLVAIVCVWLFGIDSLTAPRGTGDVIGPALARLYAPMFIVVGVVIAAAALAAWRGRAGWWKWQIAAVAFVPAAFVTTLFLLQAGT